MAQSLIQNWSRSFSAANDSYRNERHDCWTPWSPWSYGKRTLVERKKAMYYIIDWLSSVDIAYVEVIVLVYGAAFWPALNSKKQHRLEINFAEITFCSVTISLHMFQKDLDGVNSGESMQSGIPITRWNPMNWCEQWKLNIYWLSPLNCSRWPDESLWSPRC